MTAPETIHQLVKRFDEHRDAYRSGKYNETQLRREFLDPFFDALGWDVFNRQGYAEMYKDVIHEDSLEIEGANKAPDYSFRVGGQRKFFLEAKKPAVKIETDIHPAFQLRRYAWSAKLPLSLLSDFEELAIYDCRAKPDKKDKASVGRIRLYSYQDYIEKWDEIAAIFSREAVLKGSFDAFAEGNKLKKGTTEVDDAFLSEIERWRDLLATNIAIRNPSLNVREMNYAVQMTIDRIVFLRICEDRGVERDEQLKEIGNPAPTALAPSGRGTSPNLGEDGRGSVYAALCQLFKRADARYNSGLFHFTNEKDASSATDTLTLSLTIDDKPLQDILKNLYYPESPYVFREIPSDILGQVYERFLGKVIRLTAGHRAKVEEKPEVRKAGGVYYTPTFIVGNIVKNTVGKLLEGKTPKEVARLRFLDPACGSGTFPLGIFQYLLDWHLKWYIENDPEKWATGKNPAIYQTKDGYRLTTSKKKEILLNNIYGVDIDPQAVEVTKLSLLLKVLEGESNETIGSQLALFQERVLPDLGRNIKCGNSLIGFDYFEGQLLVDDEERARINPFDWKAEFPHVFAQGGFDAVVGNPPYGAILTQQEGEYILRTFNLQQYQLDSYLLFIERSLQLVKRYGLVGFIIPNTWLLNLLSAQIRKYIFENSALEEIVHHRYKVFKDATVDTEIVVFRNSIPDTEQNIRITVEEKDGAKSEYFIPQSRWIVSNGAPVNLFEKNEFSGLAGKIKAFTALDEVCKITQGTKPFQVGKGKPAQTQKIVDEKPFVSDFKKNKTFRPLLRGSLMNRYKTNWNDNYWISFGDWLAEPRYSASHDADEKIVIRQTGDSLIATLDTNQFVVRDNLYTIVSTEINLRYVLALLNSRLLNWFYQSILNPEKGEALAQVKRGHLSQLPIRPINFSDPADKARHDKMVSLVERMLALHKAGDGHLGGDRHLGRTPQEQEMVKREIESTDKAIDRLVYELYGLSEEEIGIVEQR